MPRTTQTQPKENYDLVLYRLEQIEKKIDSMSKNYVTRDEFEGFRDEVRENMLFSKRRNLLDKIMVTLFTSIVVSLSWYVISDILKKG
jgi:hypothetical protein